MSGSPYIIEVTLDNYQQVMEASFQVPVLVDFWADWCQPCKALMPLLANLAEAYQGKFLLAKVNTEEQQEIAAQFAIRSIPTVKLFRDGQPVDEFMGALPENEIRRFLDKHIPRESDNTVQKAQQLLSAGDAEGAIALLEDARSSDPENQHVSIALAQAQAATGNAAGAEAILNELPVEEQGRPDVASLRSQLYFEGLMVDMPPKTDLEARITTDENDSGGRFKLAIRQIVDQEYEHALENLLLLMRKDRAYGDDAARTTMLKVFDLLSEDVLVSKYRSRMASLLN